MVLIYFADSNAFRRTYDAGGKRALVSFAYVLENKDSADWVTSRPADAELFMDSGAFGVFTGKARITLDSYSDYLRHIGTSAVSCYASLDVIGDWRATARNYDRMVADGFSPIPTFHKGSPWHELERIASSGVSRIALGGMAGKTTSQTVLGLGVYLDQAWSIIRKHWPVKVHAFGVVGQEILERYPFYSADSTSAILSAGMGRVLRFEHGLLRTGTDWRVHAPRTMDMTSMDKVGGAREGRRILNVAAMLKLERSVTASWEARGVSWSDDGTYTGRV